jgi:ribosomal protein L40E
LKLFLSIGVFEKLSAEKVNLDRPRCSKCPAEAEEGATLCRVCGELLNRLLGVTA